MVEIGFFMKSCNHSTAATIRIDSALIVTALTLVFQVFLSK